MKLIEEHLELPNGTIVSTRMYEELLPIRIPAGVSCEGCVCLNRESRQCFHPKFRCRMLETRAIPGGTWLIIRDRGCMERYPMEGTNAIQLGEMCG